MRRGNNSSYISHKWEKGCFTLSNSGRSAPLLASSEDYPGVIRALKQLQVDIGLVTNVKPELFFNSFAQSKEIVLVGTLGKSPLIDTLAEKRKIDSKSIAGCWEAFMQQVVEEPFPGVHLAFVIAGSDKRGTIYGIYDLCSHIGVSPWYFWADVPVRLQSAFFVLPGCYTSGEPAVKYRGIFINDEAPALSRWVYKKYGGFNHLFYEKVFALLLRLKANYLWPAMWGHAFYDDDPLNPQLADEYGIVIGTSHHEPMMRAHVEWRRYGTGQWNYENNEAVLKRFWRKGIRNICPYESIITMGMRGDGDKPMSEEANITLLEKILSDQQEIITEVTGKERTAIPQLWAIYKEVQEYYEKGIQIPDEVTLLFCDDNWGNIRKVPEPGVRPQSGGYGMYYHFDYVGEPRNYKWVNTNPISRVWEQMNLAYHYGVKKIWIVNAGDIKPMEFPTQFFLDHAWNADKWSVEDMSKYTQLWAEQQFGAMYAAEIAGIISRYARYNSRRKPELLSPDTYSLVHYREAETIVADYRRLADEAERIYDALPSEYRDAYYQLVLYTVLACANLNELYVTVGKNHMYARQGRAKTNELAARVKALFAKDTEYTRYYNEVMSEGKWKHMMDQTHIGYTSWQQPEENIIPEVKEIVVPEAPDIGVAIEGSDRWWPKSKDEAVLPEFDMYQQQEYYIEIFNRGQTSFHYTIECSTDWLHFSCRQGMIEKEERLWVSVDWKLVPTGKHHVPFYIIGPNETWIVVQTVVNNPDSPKRDDVRGFVEGNGYISMEAEHYNRAVSSEAIKWQCIPHLGRTLSAVTPFPVTASIQSPGGDSPRLEYRMYIWNSGDVVVRIYLSPTLNFNNVAGLQYAISFDNEPPQTINIHADHSNEVWMKSVSDNIRVTVSRHHIDKGGWHVLKFWMVHPGVVLQKLVVETTSIALSYLGPPESFYCS
jgi:hypothetical protein